MGCFGFVSSFLFVPLAIYGTFSALASHDFERLRGALIGDIFVLTILGGAFAYERAYRRRNIGTLRRIAIGLALGVYLLVGLGFATAIEALTFTIGISFMHLASSLTSEVGSRRLYLYSRTT